MRDPIVDEVREARRKHAQQFGFDLRAICADLKKKEKEYEQKYGHPVKSSAHTNCKQEPTMHRGDISNSSGQGGSVS